MNSQLLLYVLAPLFLLLVVYVTGARRLLSRLQLNPSVRHLLGLIVAVEVALLVLNTLVWHNTTGFFQYFLDLDEEWTFGVILEALQLLMVGMAALLIAAQGRLYRVTRVYMALLGVTFTLLGLDEFFSLHERLVSDQNTWPLVYWIVGGVLALVSVQAFRRELHKYPQFVSLLVVAVAVIGAGAVLFERFSWDVLCVQTELCKEYTVFEEGLELAGGTLALMAFAALARDVLPARTGRRQPRMILGLAAVWLAALLGYVWLWPALELRLLATPANASYLDGDLSLVGYRVSSPTAAPGDRLDVTLYFRANDFLAEDYSLSLHAMTHPEVASVGQVDDLRIGAYPSTAWLPGVTVRKTLSLPLSANTHTPQSLWLALRLWTGPWQESWENTVGLEVRNTDQPLLTTDTLVLGSVPVLSPVVDAPPESPGYRFEGGIALAGHSLPDDAQPGGDVRLRFWWRTTEAIDAAWVQYVHVVGPDGALLAAYDSQPFGGAFPTADWPRGILVSDTVAIALPGGTPPGEYHVFTGLYDAASGARANAQALDAQPVSDNNIDLGVLAVVAE